MRKITFINLRARARHSATRGRADATMARRADVDALIAGFERCASTAPLFAEDSSSDERASARRLEDARDDARDRSASDSDWSDAELRESDGAAFDEKPPSAAQGASGAAATRRVARGLTVEEMTQLAAQLRAAARAAQAV